MPMRTKKVLRDILKNYATMIDAPIETGVTVDAVTPHVGRAGFHVQTTAGDFDAQNVVSATGPFQKPSYPKIVPSTADIVQMHSTAYRNPDELADGAILVIGGGSSGSQIAAELNEAGRKVFFSIGPHDRPFRSYRGRDNCWWLGSGNMEYGYTNPRHRTCNHCSEWRAWRKTADFRRLADAE